MGLVSPSTAVAVYGFTASLGAPRRTTRIALLVGICPYVCAGCPKAIGWTPGVVPVLISMVAMPLESVLVEYLWYRPFESFSRSFFRPGLIRNFTSWPAVGWSVPALVTLPHTVNAVSPRTSKGSPTKENVKGEATTI